MFRAEVLLWLSCKKREQVETMVAKALLAGGFQYAEPKDYGFQYQHSFQDPDGHQGELVHLSLMPENKANA